MAGSEHTLGEGSKATHANGPERQRMRSGDKPPFYKEDITSTINPEIREMLETYGGIPSDQVVQHVHATRDKAWAVAEHATLGLGAYLTLALPKSPLFKTVISRLHDEESTLFMEIGVMLGLDLRTLVAKGVSSEKLIAVDIVDFWDVGYEMFRDRDTFKCTYIKADILDCDGPLRKYRGSIAFLYIRDVLHQFDYETQVEACHRLVELSKVGTVLFGYHTASVTARVFRPAPNRPVSWKHDAESWKKMWERVEMETGTRWEIEVTLMGCAEFGLHPNAYAFLGEDGRYMSFVHRRVA